MRMIFSAVGLLLVLAIVAFAAKKQVQGLRPPPSAASQPHVAGQAAAADPIPQLRGQLDAALAQQAAAAASAASALDQ